VWASAIAAVAVWLLVARAFIPWLIGQAYAGRSLGFLNRMISGSAVHPLELYLTQWTGIAKTLTFIFATLALVVCVVASFRSLLRAHGAATFAPEAGLRGWPAIKARLGDLMPVAVWFGLAVGLSEAWYIAGKAFFVHEVILGFRYVSPDSIWMAPVADFVLFIGVALLLVAVCFLVDRGRAFRIAVFVFSFIAAAALLMMHGRLHTYAGLILSLGLAFQASRYARRNAGPLRGAMRASLVPMLLVWASAAIAVRVSQRTPSYGPQDARAAASPEQPNVLLIILDTVRAASLSLYGHDRQTTPNLERLASRGVVFERAISTSPWTLPSHASMFTGRLNDELGTGFLSPLDDTYPTLAEELTGRGYATGGFVANIVFCTEFFGLNRGFERYVDQPLNLSMLFASSWIVRETLPPLRGVFGNHQSLVRKRAATVNREFLAWMSEIEDRPFFAFLNYFDGHAPYLPPDPYRRLFWPDQPLYWLSSDHAADYEPEAIEQLEAAYDGSIAYLDEQLGLLLEELESRGQLRNTVVIVTSDHGESFGEHGSMGHGRTVYLTELRVPMLVLLPGAAHAGTRIGEPVSLRNIAATVMDLVGGADDSPLPGYSLAPHWNGAGDRSDRTAQAGDYVVSELVGKKSLTIGDYHYWRDRLGNEELYLLEDDPWETRNLIESGSEELTIRLRAQLDTALAFDVGSGQSASSPETRGAQFP